MIERRKHKRIKVKEGVFAVIRGPSGRLDHFTEMSMGEIAVSVYKSNPVKLGQIKNISAGGLAFHYIPAKSSLDGPFELDILMTEKNIYLHNVPFEIISDEKIEKNRVQTVPVKRTSLRFVNLSDQQLSKLQYIVG